MKPVTVTEQDLVYLAEQILGTFCPEGMRNAGGRFTKFPYEDHGTELRRTVKFLKERFAVIAEGTKQTA